MKFMDPAVESAVMEALEERGLDMNKQLDLVDELYITGAKSLADLVQLPGLRKLYIGDSDLEDAHILSGLTQLTELGLTSVSGVKSEHVAPLSQLSMLQVWYRSDHGEHPFDPWNPEPLAALTNLRTLDLQDLGIEDISFLKEMKHLKRLTLDGNPVRDASPLLKLRYLEYLSMDLEHLEDRRIFADKRLASALKGVCTDFPELAPPEPKKAANKRKSMPRLEYLADVHSWVHFCRNAALVRLKDGLDKLVCRDYGIQIKKEVYDLYLDGVPLVETHIPSCGTCGTRLFAGYGDGLMNQEECLAVRDQLNAGFKGIEESMGSLAPLVGLMKDGLYLVADFDLFPVQYNGGDYLEYFWDVPSFSSELHFYHGWGGDALLDAPLFLAPSQRAAQMNPARVDHYRARLSEERHFPRAVALYLNGGVALLLDGHHKAAACAAEGVPVKTLVIFPIEDGTKLKEALAADKKLFIHHSKHIERYSCGAGPLKIRDEQGEELEQVSCLQRMKRRRLFVPELEKVEWGRVPDEYRTEKFKDYPRADLLSAGTLIQPDQIRTLIECEMKKPKSKYDIVAISLLQNYASLFPESEWLSDSERAWLSRPDEEF